MSHLSGLRRYASAAGAGCITVLALAVPSPADADPPDGPAPGVDVGAAKNMIPEAPHVDVPRLLDEIDRPLQTYPGPVQVPDPETVVVRVDDGSLELVQITLGALAGAAVVAGGAAAVRTRHRHHLAHPA